jgi:hypothetical protein
MSLLAAEVNAKKLPAIAGKAGLRLPPREKALMGRPCRIASVADDGPLLPAALLAPTREPPVPPQGHKEHRPAKATGGKQITLNLRDVNVG